MNSIKTLGVFVIGAISIAVFYGIAFGGKDSPVSFEFDDGEGVRHVVNGDRGDFMLREDDLSIEASWRGDYELNDDASDIARLDRKLEITRKESGVTERVIFEDDDDEVDRAYYRDGVKLEAVAETDAAASELLLAFLRASGVKADERVTSLLKKGGPDAVLEEMTFLYGDHARQRYVSTLTASTDLSTDQLRRLIGVASDMEGDNDIRRALEAIIKNEKIEAEAWPAIVSAADKMESDYDLRRLVETVAEHDVNTQTTGLLLDLFNRIDSDHDLRRAGEALLKKEGALTGGNVAALLSAAAARIDSDHDLRLLLTEAASRIATSEEIADAWLEGYSALSSDHDKRLVLEEASNNETMSDETALKLIAATGDIDSDHDHRLALAALTAYAEKSPELRAAYLSSAQAISSDHERSKALEAVGEETGE